MKKLILIVMLFYSSLANAQWVNTANESEIFTRFSYSSNNNFGLNLEPSGTNHGHFIHNNMNGVNQQVFYFGHANRTKQIFGISSTKDSGGNWKSRFVIDNNGNVGIGTNNLDHGKLTITQNEVDDYSSGLRLQNQVTGQSSYIRMDNSNNLRVDNATNASRNIILNGTGSGKVGIGSNSPTSKLFVKQSSEGSGSGVSIQDLATRTINIYGEGASGRQVISTSGTNNPLAFILNGTEAMRLDHRGHVGIGTTNLSDFKLSVDGKIRATEVKVYTGWADYVFEEGYHLKP
uniref:hypothetical protein n=1 Tax=Flammeovirga sp. OC4 TaxID=1382345 RepID=UPI001C10B2CF